MNLIISPLRVKDRSDAVANLQEGLLMLDKGVLQLTEPTPSTTKVGLTVERATSSYGPTTDVLVGEFQRQKRTPGRPCCQPGTLGMRRF